MELIPSGETGIRGNHGDFACIPLEPLTMAALKAAGAEAAGERAGLPVRRPVRGAAD